MNVNDRLNNSDPAPLAPELIAWASRQFGVTAYDQFTTLN